LSGCRSPKGEERERHEGVVEEQEGEGRKRGRCGETVGLVCVVDTHD